jgi:DNA polymerase
MAKIELARCGLCKEKLNSMHPVPGCGPKDAAICFLAHLPGKIENRVGKPFMGPIKEKFEQGLSIAGLSRGDVWITNVYKCYPAGVHVSRMSMQICKDAHLGPELAELPKLKMVVAMGNVALKYFEPEGWISDLHGTTVMSRKPWSKNPDDKILVFASYDPGAAVKDEVINERYIADMKKLGEIKL